MLVDEINNRLLITYPNNDYRGAARNARAWKHRHPPIGLLAVSDSCQRRVAARPLRYMFPSPFFGGQRFTRAILPVIIAFATAEA